VFGNIDSLKQARLKELHTFDRLETEKALDLEEKLSKSLISSDLKKITLQEEISWRQKSRVRWLKEGDKCTKFFHRLANSNWRFNSIEFLSVNGSVTFDPPVIGDHVVQFYDSLFSKHHNWRSRLDNLTFDSLEVEKASWIELPFEEREVLKVVKGMNRDKAPCSDGFSMAFFQDCWDVIKYDLMKVLLDFHTHSYFKRSLNASFIALIPNKAGAIDISDFWPISLISGVYKIIAKVLANRMSSIMEKIISKPQNAFVKGR